MPLWLLDTVELQRGRAELYWNVFISLNWGNTIASISWGGKPEYRNKSRDVVVQRMVQHSD
jgi:hypothetical protein